MGKHKRSKDKKKKKDKRRKHSSSSSSNSDSGEWVEKVVDAPKVDKQEENKKVVADRDEWMDLSSIIPCTSKDELRKAREAEKQQEKSAIVEAPGQSDRESNPYWKNGGTGMPEENKSANTMMDVKWLKKSLKRAEEFAREEGKSLEEVAAARWGSLDKIKEMIQDAEARSGRTLSNRRNNYDSKSYGTTCKRDRSRSRSRERRRSNRSRSREKYRDDTDQYRSSMRKPKEDDYSANRNSRNSKSSFKKPSDNDDHYSGNKSSYSSSSRSSKNWRKPDFKKVSSEEENTTIRNSSPPKREQPVQDVSDEPLTEEQMNLLGAKIVKAEIMGRHELVTQLKKRLERARELRKHAVDNKSDNVVLLTKTDNKGNTRFLSQTSATEETNSRKKKRIETHEQQQRVRYFADDDKYSLQDMFERERGRSNVDDDAVFTKLMSKKNDMEEVFEEQITKESSSSKQDARERMRAIKEHQTMTKSLDNCHLCIDSDRMLKHTIITTASKIYLSLPATSSLVTGHCILSTITHIPCQIQLDEDYCEELKEFKNKLTKLFAKQDKEPVFIETYVKRNKFPHMKVECIPLPRDEASMAPIYFKKALLECETEWAVNKKVVEFTNLQRSIPKGLPYFAVEFAMDGGFAHVIEDEMLFSQNFAHEVIGGMLDVETNLWRKPKRENIEDILEKVQEFQQEWNNL